MDRRRRGRREEWGANGNGWTEIVRGPERPRGQTIALDAERLDLGPGRLRILSRCWLAPVAPVSSFADSPAGSGVPASLTIELVPQHRDSTELRFGGARPRELPQPVRERPDEGLLFLRLMVRMTVRSQPASPISNDNKTKASSTDGLFAYLLVPERPGIDWRDALAVRPEDETDSDSDARSMADDRKDPPGVGQVVRNGATEPGVDRSSARVKSRRANAGDAGPASPAVPTLGEALFGRRHDALGRWLGARPGRGECAALVVLIPRVPASYQLVAPVRRGAGGEESGSP